MPRINEETSTLLSDLSTRLQRLVIVARQEGRDSAFGEVRSLINGGFSSSGRRRGRPRENALAFPAASAVRRRRKNSWAGLSAEGRLARVNAIRKGKGLPPKDSL